MSEEQTTAMTTTSSQELRLSGPRLPFHPAIEERFGIDRGTWKVITDVIFPAAEATESIVMALSYCRARNLDIMKKPVHIVPVWDRKRGKMVDSVWPAISESRITAMRTGEYAGKDETVFGPEITESLGGVDMTYPEWAVVTVYRFIKGVRCPFSGERVRWKEYYAKAKKDTLAPNDMWKTKTYSQISKCAEASALRTAFPEEVPSDGTAEEMEGQEVAMVHTGDGITGSGVMGRLSGKQEGAGFDHEEVAKQATRKPRAKVTEKPQDAPAAAQATTLPKEAETPASEAAAAIGGDDLPEGLRPQPDAPAVEGSASSATSPGSEENLDDGSATNASQGWMTMGPAPAGTVYRIADSPVVDGRALTFKDGVRFSTCDAANPDVPVYEQHAPEVADPNEAADHLPADMPPEVKAYALQIQGCTIFGDVKKALAEFQKGDFWKAMTEDDQNELRFNTWDIVQAGGVTDLPAPHADISAFRLWIEWEEDPEVIEQMLSTTEDNPDFKAKSDGVKEMVRGATAARLKALEG